MYYFNNKNSKGGERENDNYKHQGFSRGPSQEGQISSCIGGHFIESINYQGNGRISEKKEKEVNYGLYCKKARAVCH